MSIECPKSEIANLIYGNVLFNDKGQWSKFIKIGDTEYAVYYNHGAISSLLFL